MTKKTATTDELSPIVHDFLTKNPNALNSTMAEEASRHLSRPISSSDISRARKRIGLSMFDQIADRVVKRIFKA